MRSSATFPGTIWPIARRQALGYSDVGGAEGRTMRPHGQNRGGDLPTELQLAAQHPRTQQYTPHTQARSVSRK